jgi:Pyruvate/2-oxoacid:ferredoxin oxidoreductase gamma subunit
MLIDAERLAKAAGLAQATNMVLAGAASHRLPVQALTMERFIVSHFERKGAKVIKQNLAAFTAGREAAAPCPSPA